MDPAADDPANSHPRRGSSAVASGIALSRLAGLVRESLLRSVLGLGPAADAFAAALRLPNLLQNLLGEGSLSASFIPVYSRLLGEGRDDEAGRVAGAVAGLLTALAGGLVVVAIVLARPLTVLLAPGFEGRRLDLTVDLMRITTGGLGLLVLSAWCLGVLNSHRRFFLPYVAPVLWNAAQIAVLAAAAFGAWSPRQAAVALAWGLVAGGALQFGVQALAVWRLAPDLRPSLGRGIPAVAEVRRRFGPAVLGRGVLQLSGYLDLVLASLLVTGAVAGHLSAQMLYALPVALFATSVAAVELPEMSRPEGRLRLAERALAARRRTSFFVAFSTVAYLVLGEAIVGALFGWGAFDADALGLPAVASSRIYQNTLYATGDTAGPARIAALRVALAAAVGVALMFPMDRIAVHGAVLGSVATEGGWFGPLGSGIRSGSPDPHLGAVGLAIGSAVAAWMELALLAHRCRTAVPGLPGPSAVMSRLAPATAVAVVVALAVRWGASGLPDVALAPLGLLLAGSAYVLVARATGVAEADLVLAPVRRMRAR